MSEYYHNSFKEGAKDGVPIALGYFSVSFAIGISAVSMGFPVWATVLISLFNVTSAGEVAGMPLIIAGAPMIEMVLTQLVINLRYALMSLSLTQKLDQSLDTASRLGISYGVTDEIFAMAYSKSGTIGSRYMAGLIAIPVFGWTFGTFLGAAASSLLPPSLGSALGIAIYGMFLAIVLPPAKRQRAVRVTALIAAGFSCFFRYVLPAISSGFSIILSAVAASAIAAAFFPIKDPGSGEKEAEDHA